MKKISNIFLFLLSFALLAPVNNLSANYSNATETNSEIFIDELYDVFPDLNEIRNDIMNNEIYSFYSDNDIVYSRRKSVGDIKIDDEYAEYTVDILADGTMKSAKLSRGLDGEWETTSTYKRLHRGSITAYEYNYGGNYRMANLHNINFTINYYNYDVINTPGEFVNLTVLADYNGQGGYNAVLVRNYYKKFETSGSTAKARFKSGFGNYTDEAFFSLGNNQWYFAF